MLDNQDDMRYSKLVGWGIPIIVPSKKPWNARPAPFANTDCGSIGRVIPRRPKLLGRSYVIGITLAGVAHWRRVN